jgi:hypothetical protein
MSAVSPSKPSWFAVWRWKRKHALLIVILTVVLVYPISITPLGYALYATGWLNRPGVEETVRKCYWPIVVTVENVPVVGRFYEWQMSLMIWGFGTPGRSPHK